MKESERSLFKMRIKKNINELKSIKGKITFILLLLYMKMSNLSVKAGALKDTKLATGTIKLIDDATTILLGLVLAIGVLLGLYFFIRKNAADEQEQPRWDKRLKTDIFCTIGGTVFSAVLKVVVGYYA